MRVSFLGKKIGMTQVVHNSATIPVTLLHVCDYDVFGVKTLEKDGYNAIVISAGDVKKDKNITKPILQQFKKKNIIPREKIFEIRVESKTSISSFKRDEESFLHSINGLHVDVSAVTMGKGFAGPMKRWNFAGLEASHGVSVSHRSHGSTGQRQDPGKVFKGKKMAGHMGASLRTIQNLQIISFDAELNILAVHGAVPCPKGSHVFINDSIKKGRQNSFPKVNDINLIF